jgi:F-type H+-transporting ATPase subunit b
MSASATFVVFAAEEGNGFLLAHDKAEVAWSALASVIVIAFLWWKAGPFAKKALTDRTDKIARDIDDAGRTRADATSKLADVQGRIASAEDERQRILVEARQTAEFLRQQIVARAAAEADAIKVRAAADIESSKGQATADLRAEVAALAVGAAEAIIARNLDPATQAELIEGFIEQVGAS